MSPPAEEIPTFISMLGWLGKPAVGIPLGLALFAYGARKALQLSEGSPEPMSMRALRAIDRGFAQIEEVVLAGLLLFLIFLATYQAYKRNYAPPSPFYTDELIRYSVFGIGLLGAALASQSERLINIDMFTRMLNARGRLILRMITTAFTVYVCIMLIRGGLHVRKINILLQEEGEVIAPATGILALPIGAGLIGLHLTLHTIIDAYYLATGKTPPETEKAPV